ncbi:unnamed protein product [Malus baccata var. baccata]
MLVLLCVLEMANQGVELATKEEESYKGRVNNLSQASHILGAMRHKFKDAQLTDFSASCFGHLENDLEGLKYLIGCEVPEFTKNDFCLITGLHCDEPYDLEVEPFNIRLLTNKGKGKGVKNKGKVTCAELEKVFKQCKDEDDALKMRLVYLTKGVVRIGVGIQKNCPTGEATTICNMTNPVAIPRILRWSTMNKQSIHEQVKMYITET